MAHTPVLRCLYAYFSEFDIKDIPFINFPENTIIKLLPHTYFCKEERVQINPHTGRKDRFFMSKDEIMSKKVNYL